MNLRFKLYSIAGATALLSTSSDAFNSQTFLRAIYIGSRSTSVSTSTSTARPSSLDRDWDNEDFLSSLSGSQEQREKAKDKYQKQADSRQKMVEWRAQRMAKENPEFFEKMGLSEELAQLQQQQQQQPPPQPQRSQPPSPQRQKMESPPAQQQQQTVPSPDFYKKMGLGNDGQPPPAQHQQVQRQPPSQATAPPQQQQMQPPAPQQQQLFDANGNPITMPMVYDANGNLVSFTPQQMQQPPPQQPTQTQMPPQINLVPHLDVFEPPLPSKNKGDDSPRPVGINADAYTVSNTADVYFAQLKQDSKVRKIARMSGDVETANKVFADESVKQIGGSWNENPYTKEKNMEEARAQIEHTVRTQTEGGGTPRMGISYKDKLEMAKANRGGGGSGVVGHAVGRAQPPAVPASAPPRAFSPPPPPVPATVASVESALKMYKSATPENREALMIQLREALAAATGLSR